jgi:hypothetical protein
MGVDDVDGKKHWEPCNYIVTTAFLAESSGSELDQKYQQKVFANTSSLIRIKSLMARKCAKTLVN